MPAVSAKPMDPVADSVLIESKEFLPLNPKWLPQQGPTLQQKKF